MRRPPLLVWFRMRDRTALVRTLSAGAVLIALVTGQPAHAREVVDATETKVKLVDHPSRIVTLAPSLGELAADMSGDSLSRIVGVSEYTDYPPALAKVASIGQYTRFN